MLSESEYESELRRMQFRRLVRSPLYFLVNAVLVFLISLVAQYGYYRTRLAPEAFYSGFIYWAALQVAVVDPRILSSRWGHQLAASPVSARALYNFFVMPRCILILLISPFAAAGAMAAGYADLLRFFTFTDRIHLFLVSWIYSAVMMLLAAQLALLIIVSLHRAGSIAEWLAILAAPVAAVIRELIGQSLENLQIFSSSWHHLYAQTLTVCAILLILALLTGFYGARRLGRIYHS